MYYWDFVNFKNVPALVREATEDIYLMVNNKWDYEDTKATEKMEKIFNNSEKLLQEAMTMKATIGKRELESLNEPEKSLRIAENNKANRNKIMICGELDETILESKEFLDDMENLSQLGTFVLKMALYRFCKVVFPKVKGKKNFIDMEGWEKIFWGPLDFRFGPHKVIGSANDLFERRKNLRDEYYDCFTCSGIGKGFLSTAGMGYKYCFECIQRAFEEAPEIVEAVKELQESHSINNGLNLEKTQIKEIQDMRHLLDIMERNIEGRLTEQDKADLRNKTQEWSEDVERLIHMLAEVTN